jgi:PAS domain S-box-containing protein
VGQLADRRFTGLLEAVPDAMVCVDADGRIAVINAQAERLFGYARDELIGQPVEILVPDQARKVHQLHRAGYIADPRSRPMGAGMELAARRRDGSTFPAEISLSASWQSPGVGADAKFPELAGDFHRSEFGQLARLLTNTLPCRRDGPARSPVSHCSLTRVGVPKHRHLPAGR